jgi:hypothetical protein
MLRKQRKQTLCANKDGGIMLLHIVCEDTSKKRLKRKGIEINFMNTLRHPAKTEYCRKNKQRLDQTADPIDDEVVKFLLCANTNCGFSCRKAYRHAGHVALQIRSTWFLSPLMAVRKNLVSFVSVPSCASWNPDLSLFDAMCPQWTQNIILYIYISGLIVLMASLSANFEYGLRTVDALSGLIMRIL